MAIAIDRRRFLALGASASLLGACRTARQPSPSKANNQPNIIFIMVDDLGYGDLGCYGQREIETPRIDELARAGTRFTECYAGSPVCAPSRSVLMTGKHTGHTTVRGNFGKGGVVGLGGGKGRVPLREEDVTVAQVLKGAGYATGITGKWGLGEPDTSGEPNDKGFDEWFGYLNQRRAHSYYPDFVWLNRDKVPLEGNVDKKQEQYTHDLFADFALDFIQRRRDEPFFLYVPFTIPHSKLEVPSLGQYADKPWKDSEKAYAAMISRMDADVGRMVDLLKKLGLTERTYVFFCSDNGAAARYDGRFDSSGPLRGRKRDVTEGGLRTPMIVSRPGTVAAGAVCDEPWYFADVLPTFAEMAGADAPDDIDGVSVLPTIHGEKQNLRDRLFYWEFHEGGFVQAARWRDWKVIRPKDGKATELYDLSKDVGEANNLAEKHPEVVKRLEMMMRAARTPSADWPAPVD